MKIEVLHGKILHSVAGDVVEVSHLPVGPPGADLGWSRKWFFLLTRNS
jgi:hypothetical protein